VEAAEEIAEVRTVQIEERVKAILAEVDEEGEMAAAVEASVEEVEVEEEAEEVAEEAAAAVEGLGLTAEIANINPARLFPTRHTRQYRKGNTYMASGA